MSWGSVTSVGIAYPRELTVEDLARHIDSLLGSVLLPRSSWCWPLRFVGGAHDAWVEVELKEGAASSNRRGLLAQYLGSEYGELEVTVDLEGVDPVEGVLRPETAYSGLLLDLPDQTLFPEKGRAGMETVSSSIRELLLRWFDASRFAVAFADHEAEFDVDPLELSTAASPFALLATPSNSGGGSPLVFHTGGWPISPLGA